MSGDLDDQVRLLESSWFSSDPYGLYARLRREAPVFWSDRDQLWALSKYDDIRFVSRNPELFANGYHVYVTAANIADDGQPNEDGSTMARRAELRRLAALGPKHSDNLVMADGERHVFLRKIASHAFTPKAIGRLEEQVREITAQLFDEIPRDEEVDFVDRVAAPVPMMMIALMLGVPVSELDRFRVWSDAFIEFADESTHGEPGFEDRLAEVIEFREYFTEQLRDRVDHPRDDLMTELVQARWQGEPLSIDDQLGMAQVLMVGGNETTRGLISLAGRAMAEHPDQRRILVESPDLIPNAVEEFLRYGSPVTHMCRTATEDVEIRGRTIARGDYVCLLYPAANRDEDVWERAEELDVTRTPDPSHLAFGFAEHFCLGANLARREARIVLGELLARFPDYEITGDVSRMRQHMVPGIKKMPAVFH